MRGGLRMILDGEPDMTVVGEAADGLEAVDAARRRAPGRRAHGHPHAAPGRHRGDAPHRRGARATDLRVLMLTTFGLDEYVYDALRAGASGFMLKDAPPEELVEAVRVVAGGAALLAPAVTRSVIEEFAQRSPAPRPRAPALSPS